MIHFILTITLLVSILLPNYTPQKTINGFAPHYGIGVMDIVARNRNLPIVNCMVSSPYEKIGTWVKVKSLKNNKELLCRVTDQSAPKDRKRHIRKKYIVELEWKSAKILCDLTYVGQEPPKKCPVEVTVISQ